MFLSSQKYIIKLYYFQDTVALHFSYSYRNIFCGMKMFDTPPVAVII